MNEKNPAFDPNDDSDLLDYIPAPIPDDWVGPPAVFGLAIITDYIRADTILDENQNEEE